MDYSVAFGEPPAVDRYGPAMEPPRWTLPSIHQISTAIKDFQRSPNSISIFALQDIMALVYLPEHFTILKGPMIQSCLSVLQRSATRGNIVGDEISILTLQILCLSVSVAVLVRCNWHKGFLRSLEAQRDRVTLPDEQIDISMQLVSWLAIHMGDLMGRGSQDLNHGLAAAHSLFGFEDGEPRDDTPVCLQDIGGIDKYHAQFLIEHLWRDRKYLMKPFQEVFLPGMSVLIYILWKHVEFMDEDHVPILFKQLCELVIRYSLVCINFEDIIMQRHYQELSIYAKDLKQSRVVDRDDLAMVVSCFVLKLAPPPFSPGSFTQIPLHYAFQLMEVMIVDISEAKEYALCQPLQIAGFTRVWFELAKIPEDKEIKWTDIVPFTFIMLKITEVNLHSAEQPSRKAINPGLAIALEADLVSLLGRLCLAPLLLPEVPPGLESGKIVKITEIRYEWKDLASVNQLVEAIAGLPKHVIQATLKPYYPEWLATYRFLCQLDGHISPSHRLWRWITECVDPLWYQLGLVCQFWVPKGQCTYPRCAGSSMPSSANFMCTRCSVPYCSFRCQICDWVAKPNSHQVDCQPDVIQN